MDVHQWPVNDPLVLFAGTRMGGREMNGTGHRGRGWAEKIAGTGLSTSIHAVEADLWAREQMLLYSEKTSGTDPHHRM